MTQTKDRPFSSPDIPFEDSQSQLIQAEKMATLGQMSAAIMHEVKNPLAFVKSNLEVLNRYVDGIYTVMKGYRDLKERLSYETMVDGAELKEEIDSIGHAIDIDYLLEDLPLLLSDCHDGVRRVEEIVEDVQSFSRWDHGKEQEVNVQEVFEHAMKIAQLEMKNRCSVKQTFSDIPRVKCSPGLLCQVFLNLLLNSVHSLSDKGQVTVTGFADGDHLKIAIADNGCGISERDLKKVTQPFFTTKERGVGTGLGLWISQKIVHQYQGQLDIQSKEGEGTTCTVTLPLNRSGE